MEKLEFRIINTLSRRFNTPVTISELTREIRLLHGAAHYANVYRRVQQLESDGVITTERIGNASLISLNRDSYQMVDWLAEAEIIRERELLRDNPRWQMLIDQLSTHLGGLHTMGTPCLIDAERNLKRNRLELLFRLEGRADGFGRRAKAVRNVLRQLQASSAVRIDALILSDSQFRRFVSSPEKNPVKEMLSSKLAFLMPDIFWLHLRNMVAHGINIGFDKEQTHPAKIPERDLVYNMARFGYKEFGTRVQEGKDICLEYILTRLLLRGDARRREAVPVLLAKSRPDYGLLIFLSQKYGVADRLHGLLKALSDVESDEELERALGLLEDMKVGEIKVAPERIERLLRLYDVAG
jgi:hypothetical protein